MSHKTDTELAVEIKDGNHRSFKTLYNRYHRKLYYLGRQYLKDQTLTEDAVQDVFLKLWRKRATLDESLAVEGLLFTMLKNHVLNMIRDEDTRQKILKGVKQSVQSSAYENVVEEKVIYDEYKQMVNEALKTLSPAKREVFEQRSFEGLTNSEVAEQRGVSEHTVKTQYYLSSQAIRNYLKKHGGVMLSLLGLFAYL